MLSIALHCIALQGQIEQEVAMQVSRSRLEFDQVAIITIVIISLMSSLIQPLFVDPTYPAFQIESYPFRNCLRTTESTLQCASATR